jgi:tetratricopeptide (TPR) repeat protein
LNDSRPDDRLGATVKWAQANRRSLTMAGVVVAIVAIGLWFTISANQRRQTFAARELLQARATADAGNLPLAMNDLQQIVERYGGTRAGEEAALTLGQLRLLQDQPELAAAELEAFAARASDQFRDQAYGLLGTALEQAGRPADAARAYLDAADATPHDLVAAQLLLDAARAFASAGDTAGAADAYERILRDLAETGAVTEARLRLAELRRSDIPG